MSANVPASKQGKEQVDGKESRRVEEPSQPNLSARLHTKSSFNKNVGASDVKASGQDVMPSMGAQVPAEKAGRGETDTSTAKHEVVTVQVAKESGGVKEAHEAQNGRAGDNFPHANSGCGDCDK
jgi:hypothetical protein